MISRTRSFIRKSGFLRWLTAPITSSYGRMWDMEGLSLGRAKKMMGACSATDTEFEAAGERYAEAMLPMIDSESRVLDLGCGIGRIALYMAPHCHELHAVDVSSRMLQHAKRRLKDLPNVQMKRIDGEAALRDFADDYFDLCYCIQVMPLIEREHTMRYLFELARVIRPGGSVYLQMLNLEFPDNARQFAEYATESKILRISRRRYYTEAEFRTYVALAGFETIDFKTEKDSLILTARVPAMAGNRNGRWICR